MDLAGRNALVTGAAVRVGRAIAEALADAGADVFVHYRSSADAAIETVESLRARGVRAVAGAADLADPAEARRLVDRATAELGPISLLVNSASGFPTDTLEDVTPEGWRRTLEVTLTAPVFLTQAFAEWLDGDGAVVNVTDARTLQPYRTHFSYIVAKGGLDTFTRAAALALAPRIRVNAVALGVILPPPGEDDAYVGRLAERLPLGRPGGTRPVADAVVCLLRNDFATGEILRIDGGGHLLDGG
ncbi:MAG TPA: SDR family oxidoreductase [Actinobacteria bacterium]|nr:SDR family oxidoreductase [Actinomycetota bacterium]